MEGFRERPARVEPGADLKTLIAGASQALARLDTGRLEELALSCQALNRRMAPGNADLDARKQLAHQAREAVADMTIFVRVLDATRANLHVMNRLRELRIWRLEYSERQARGGAGAGPPSKGSSQSRGRWGESAEAGHGDD